MTRRDPYAHLSLEQKAAHIGRAFGEPSPARAYNMQRGDERAAAYREQYDNPAPRWEKPEPLTEMVETPAGFLVRDHEERDAA
jgi:hypothetical protein